MERKVGEIFTYNGKTYKVIRGNRCTYCDIGNMCILKASIIGPCTPSARADKTSVVFKEINNMEIKNNQLTIDIPEGMEIDLENSDLAKGIIKFKSKSLTYNDAYRKIPNTSIVVNTYFGNEIKLRALVKLMNIAKYYNGDWQPDWKHRSVKYYIYFDNNNNEYDVNFNDAFCQNIIYFKNSKDARVVIDNPNFRDILDTIYKN